MIERITVRGARQHNLKNIDVEIPRHSMTVVTGLSGSGKSSLAFDVIYAEGQRRYVQTLSAYARQFLDQLERPDVDAVEGLSPAISIEQKTTSRSPRSTVGTITEIYDYLRLLYSSIGEPHCHKCGRRISRQTTEQIVAAIMAQDRESRPEGGEGQRVMILAPVVRGRKGEFRKLFEQLSTEGYLRVRVDKQLRQVDEEIRLDRRRNHTIEVVVDRLLLKPGIESRLAQSIDTAMKLAKGVVQVAVVNGEEHLYSQEWACVDCGTSIPALEPRSFSFNSIYGACPACRGLGSQYTFDPAKVIVDWTRPLLEGGLGPGASSSAMQRGLARAAEQYGFDLKTPFQRLPVKIQNLVLFGRNPEHPSKPAIFAGVLPLLERWYGETTSENFREWYGQYMSAVPCSKCQGKRLKPESLAVTVVDLSIADLTALPISRVETVLRELRLTARQALVAQRILNAIFERLEFLANVGLGYLSLDRSAATLSSGESQRIRLATQIGSKLRGVLYVLDEPSIGLHPRDNQRLLATMERLRDLQNTVLVVEHDEETIRRADYVVDLGPGAGKQGGFVVAAGRPAEIAASAASLTGQYLSGKLRIRRAGPAPLSQRKMPGRAGRLRQQLEEHRRAVSPGLAHRGDGRLGLRQVNPGERHPLSCHCQEALPRRSRAGGAQGHPGTRSTGQGYGGGPVAYRTHPAFQSGNLHRRVHAYPRAVRDAAGIPRARLSRRPLQLQREGRPLRGLPGRRPAPHRNEFPARCLRDLRGLPRAALQLRNPGGKIQGLFHRRPAGNNRSGRLAHTREHSPNQATSPDAARRRTGLRPPGPAGHHPFRG